MIRTVALALSISMSLILASGASAASRELPPDNSGVDQYSENVPDATGDRQPALGEKATRLPSAERRGLETVGAEGALAADAIAASGPAALHADKRSGARHAGAEPSGESTDLDDEPSMVGSVLGGLGGGSSGMGALLPILIVASLLGVIAILLEGRRRGAPTRRE